MKDDVTILRHCRFLSVPTRRDGKNAAETTINDKTLLVELIFIVRTISFGAVQGSVEPPDALDRQDLGSSQILPR